MADDTARGGVIAGKPWRRIPNGTKVRHRLEGYQGAVDGLTELAAKGSSLNPDGRTQYRINVGEPLRKLAPEEDLLIVVDDEGLMMQEKQNLRSRTLLTERFRAIFSEDKFVA